MKLRKRIAAMGAAMMMAVSVTSVTANAELKDNEMEIMALYKKNDVVCSKNAKYLNALVTLNGEKFFDYSYSNDGYYRTVSTVWRITNTSPYKASEVYYLRAMYDDIPGGTDLISTYTKIKAYGSGKYHSCSVSSGGKTKGSGKDNDKTQTDHTGCVDLIKSKATFGGYYHT